MYKPLPLISWLNSLLSVLLCVAGFAWCVLETLCFPNTWFDWRAFHDLFAASKKHEHCTLAKTFWNSLIFHLKGNYWFLVITDKDYSKHYFRSGKQQKYPIFNSVSETQSSETFFLLAHKPRIWNIKCSYVVFSYFFLFHEFSCSKKHVSREKLKISLEFRPPHLLVREKLLRNSIFYAKTVRAQSA